MVVLLLLTIYLTYAVFVNPSIYRGFHFMNRIGLMIVLVTIVLFYISGSYTTTLVHSRKFIKNSNKGLKDLNAKVVKVSPTWMETFMDIFYSPAYSSKPGRVIKLVLLPKAFKQETIDDWEVYREEYWIKEYERQLRKKKAAAAASSSSNTSNITSPSKSGAHKRSIRTLRNSVDLGIADPLLRPRRKTIQKDSL